DARSRLLPREDLALDARDLAPEERRKALRHVLAGRHAGAIFVRSARELAPPPRAAPASVTDCGTAARTLDGECIGLPHYSTSAAATITSPSAKWYQPRPSRAALLISTDSER